MYFWNIEKLKLDLMEKPLSEKESFKYLMAQVILFSLAAFPMADSSYYQIISYIMASILMVVGVIYLYRCNGGDKGKNFLQKLISISWVVGIRWLIMVAIPLVFSYVILLAIFYATGLEIIADASPFMLTVILMGIYFWINGKHIHDIR